MTKLTGRPLKILQALYALSPDGPRLVTYEDIVVKAWSSIQTTSGSGVTPTAIPT